VRELTRRAQEILEDAGRSPTRSVLDRIAATLRAAAVAEPSRETLKAGRLTGDVESAGFEAYAGLELPAAAPTDELGSRRRQKSEQQHQRRELGKRAQQLERRAAEAEREAKRLEQAAAAARREAEARRREADAVALELERLQG